MSYTGTIVDWLNRDSVEEELLRDCDGARRISISKETCDDLKTRCFSFWRQKFADKPSNDAIKTVHRMSMFLPRHEKDDVDGEQAHENIKSEL